MALEESGADVSSFEQIADLTFFAVQTRYDDSLEILSSNRLLLLGISESLIKDVQCQLS
jgi:hypothetical protein